MKMRDVGIYRSYAGIFSCTSFSRMMESGNLSLLKERFHKFDTSESLCTYLDYIKFMYGQLCRFYRCEYVYKNAIVNHILKTHKRADNAVVLNEFKTGSSIADIAIFNGESVAFEVKTGLDSDRRIALQLNNYETIFDKTYIVTDESCIEKYANINTRIGLYLLVINGKNVKIELRREAITSGRLDIDILMRSLNTTEYKNMIIEAFGELPNVNSFKMYRECLALMKTLPKEYVRSMAISQFKKRKMNFDAYKLYTNELRHICVGLDLDRKRYANLIELLTNNLI